MCAAVVFSNVFFVSFNINVLNLFYTNIVLYLFILSLCPTMLLTLKEKSVIRLFRDLSSN